MFSIGGLNRYEEKNEFGKTTERKRLGAFSTRHGSDFMFEHLSGGESPAHLLSERCRTEHELGRSGKLRQNF